MSHCAKIKAEVKDLEAVKKACTRLGFEFKENQKTYTWYGRSVGDYPIPEGYTVHDLGKCDHAIKVPNVNYEIGICKSKTNPKQYDLMWDFYDQRLANAVGGNTAPKLVQAISLEQGKITARKKGFSVMEKKMDGKIRLVVNMG